MFLFLLSCVSCSGKDHFQGLQAEYAMGSQAFSGGLEREEFMLSVEKALVDFLITPDASKSMYHHLEDLGYSVSDLLFFIEDYNWRMAFTSVDHGDHTEPQSMQMSWRDYASAPYGKFGNLMGLEDERGDIGARILNSLIPNYENVFLHTLSHKGSIHCGRADCFSEAGGYPAVFTIECGRPPHCSPRLEQPLRALKSAMERANLNNSSFFRPEADLVTLIITNEEERFEDPKRATTAREVIHTFEKVFGHLNKKFIAFNILIKDEDCLEMEKTHNNRVSIAHSIMELADLTGGENISICSANYGRELRKISKHIKNTLQNSIVLKKEPIPGSLVVEFSGKKLDWKLYGRTLVFDRKKNSSGNIDVKISYQSRD